MKIALICGCSGSGKGYVTKQLNKPCQVVKVDRVRSDVLLPLRELLKGDERNRWPIWDALIPHFDVVPAFAEAISSRYTDLNTEVPIIAEGGLLAHSGFHNAFIAGLEELGVDVSCQRMFWIDPDPEAILSNRRKRSEKRESDRNATIQSVTRNVKWYRSVAKNLDTSRFGNTKAAVEAIDQFIQV